MYIIQKNQSTRKKENHSSNYTWLVQDKWKNLFTQLMGDEIEIKKLKNPVSKESLLIYWNMIEIRREFGYLRFFYPSNENFGKVISTDPIESNSYVISIYQSFEKCLTYDFDEESGRFDHLLTSRCLKFNQTPDKNRAYIILFDIIRDILFTSNKGNGRRYGIEQRFLRFSKNYRALQEWGVDCSNLYDIYKNNTLSLWIAKNFIDTAYSILYPSLFPYQASVIKQENRRVNKKDGIST